MGDVHERAGRSATCMTCGPWAVPKPTMFDELTEQWVVVSGNSEVYAEANDPAGLADWMNDCAVTVGDMHTRDEL